jgi:hypothetical protein
VGQEVVERRANAGRRTPEGRSRGRTVTGRSKRPGGGGGTHEGVVEPTTGTPCASRASRSTAVTPSSCSCSCPAGTSATRSGGRRTARRRGAPQPQCHAGREAPAVQPGRTADHPRAHGERGHPGGDRRRPGRHPAPDRLRERHPHPHRFHRVRPRPARGGREVRAGLRRRSGHRRGRPRLDGRDTRTHGGRRPGETGLPGSPAGGGPVGRPQARRPARPAGEPGGGVRLRTRGQRRREADEPVDRRRPAPLPGRDPQRAAGRRPRPARAPRQPGRQLRGEIADASVDCLHKDAPTAAVLRCELDSTEQVLATVAGLPGALGYSELNLAARAKGLHSLRLDGDPASADAIEHGTSDYPHREIEYAYTYGRPPAGSLASSFLPYPARGNGQDVIRTHRPLPCWTPEGLTLCARDGGS